MAWVCSSVVKNWQQGGNMFHFFEFVSQSEYWRSENVDLWLVPTFLSWIPVLRGQLSDTRVTFSETRLCENFSRCERDWKLCFWKPFFWICFGNFWINLWRKIERNSTLSLVRPTGFSLWLYSIMPNVAFETKLLFASLSPYGPFPIILVFCWEFS